MEKSVPQSVETSGTERAEQTSRELLRVLGNLEVEKAPTEETFNINDYVGEFYD